MFERNQADIVLNSFSGSTQVTDYLYSRELLNISNRVKHRVKHSFPDFTFVWRDEIDARNTVGTTEKSRREQKVSCDKR